MASQAYITSVTFGPRVYSRNGGKSWTAYYSVDGKQYGAGTYATEMLAAEALAKCGVALRLLARCSSWLKCPMLNL